MASTPIIIPDILVPSIGYYAKNISEKEPNSANNLTIHLTNTCTSTLGTSQSKIATTNYNNLLLGKYTPRTVPTADMETYLLCQLASARNRTYKQSDFALTGTQPTVESIFKSFSSLKYLLMILFAITIYLLMHGFFGSLDLAGNIFKIIEENSSFNAPYFVGLLIGLALPVILICLFYSQIICNNLDSLGNYEITTSPTGTKQAVPENPNRKIDYTTLILFVLLIYAFSASLLTLKTFKLNDYLYTTITGTVLFIMAIFIYLLYAFVPFFNTTDDSQIMSTNPRPLRLFIDGDPTINNEDVSGISTNTHQDGTLRKAFLFTAMGIFLGSILFFWLGSTNSFCNGLLGSTAILVIPVLWVFNFYIAINFFYFYPIILIILRFIRYICMSVIYFISLKSDTLKSYFTNDLAEQLDNFKDYSPSWGLFGADALKTILGMLGKDNIFSKSIISDDNSSSNISNNKFLASGLLGFAINYFGTGEVSNFKGMIFSIIVLVLTIIISIIILFGVVKIQDI